MKNLYIFRHGEAEDFASEGGDDARALTPRGSKAFEQAARFWASFLPETLVIFTSPLTRARQTAEILSSALRGTPKLQVESLLRPYEDPSDLIAGLPACQDLVLIGHMPQLGRLIGGLLTGIPSAQIPLSKGMGVWIRSHSWTSGRGRLRAAFHQKDAGTLFKNL